MRMNASCLWASSGNEIGKGIMIWEWEWLIFCAKIPNLLFLHSGMQWQSDDSLFSLQRVDCLMIIVDVYSTEE